VDLNRVGKLLGRFGNNADEAAGVRRKWIGCEAAGDTYRIALDRLEADPKQPRSEFDEEALELLADSLRSHGQLQPIRVRYDEARDRFVVVCGERRLRAARRAGLPALVAQVELDPVERVQREVQLIENLVRADLTPMEEARAFNDLMLLTDMDAKTLAARLGVSPAKVSRSLALLELPADTQATVEAGELRGEALRAVVAEQRAASGTAKARKKTKAAAAKREHKLKVAGGVVTVRLAKPGDRAALLAVLELAAESLRSAIGADTAAAEAA
jgi:ParB/RepB/Spo0J family partition protein